MRFALHDLVPIYLSFSESPYSLDNGYLSDGDAAFHRTGNAVNGGDDGYLSEGGASFYARKIQSRIALEKQKTAEEQRRKFSEPAKGGARPLPGLPDVLGGKDDKDGDKDMAENGIYR